MSALAGGADALLRAPASTQETSHADIALVSPGRRAVPRGVVRHRQPKELPEEFVYYPVNAGFTAVVFSPDGRTAATAFRQEGDVRMWDVASDESDV